MVLDGISVKGAEAMEFKSVCRLGSRVAPACILALCLPGLLFAQGPSPLTLQQAVNIALEKNPERKAALADGSGGST